MGVNGTALFNQRIDIGNGHPQPDCALRQHFADGELVQIERVVVVDGAPEQIGEIVNLRAGLAGGAGDGSQLPLDAGRKLRLQTALSHDAGGDADKVGAVMVVVVGVHGINIHP